MVKKTSFFEKLRNRMRTSDVRVDTESGGRASGNADALVAQRDATPVSGRKLAPREEAVLAVNEGFKELATLMRGVQNRIDDQGERLISATENLNALPALSQSQIELMRLMAQRLEKQNESTALMAKSLGELPPLMKSVKEALDRAAATDQRTSATLDQFRKNMDHIQGSMSKMVEHSKMQAESTRQVATGQKDQVDALAKTLTGEHERHLHAVDGIVDRLEETQRQSLRSLRESQADQSTRIAKTIEQGVRGNRTVSILLGLTVAALCVIAAILIAR